MKATEQSVWWKKNVRITPDRVSVKLRNQDGSLMQSILLPTLLYPVPGLPEVFTSENTVPITDQGVLNVFDSVRYHIGACYSNTKTLVDALRLEGYPAVPYVGWLFVNGWGFPIHHCWAVLGNAVLDLADDFCVMLSGHNGDAFQNAESMEKVRELIVSFAKAAAKEKNSIRCSPVGRPASFLFYVGAPYQPENGARDFRRLMRQFPNHEAYLNKDSSWLSPVQRMMRDAGLMDWTKDL